MQIVPNLVLPVISFVHISVYFRIWQKQVPSPCASSISLVVPIKIQISSNIGDGLRKELVLSQFRGTELSFSFDRGREEK